MPALRRLVWGQAGSEEALQALLRTLRDGIVAEAAKTTDAKALRDEVTQLLEAVRQRGDAALLEAIERFDGVRLQADQLRVPSAALAAAHAAADGQFLALMRRAIANVRAYQEHIRWQAPPPLQRSGRRLGVRYTPVERVGIYVPGGQALYPSTVLMTVVPALVAGVEQIALVSPPRGGDLHPMLLALAHELGVQEVWRVGGPAAIAALAYGTERIAAVHKIVGPGNAYVAEAKRQVLGRVGIDSIAGPSEVVIVADDSAPAAWVAADLLAQAEHAPGSAVLITDSAALADAVDAAIATQLPSLPRRAAIEASLLYHGAILLAADLESACQLADRFATEHLQLMTRDNAACAARIRHAGAIFFGAHTPVALGDYLAGPSHVLPTGGTARFFGPLSCNEFLKASSTLEYDAAALAADTDDVIDFAEREGLAAHAASLRMRR